MRHYPVEERQSVTFPPSSPAREVAGLCPDGGVPSSVHRTVGAKRLVASPFTAWRPETYESIFAKTKWSPLGKKPRKQRRKPTDPNKTASAGRLNWKTGVLYPRTTAKRGTRRDCCIDPQNCENEMARKIAKTKSVRAPSENLRKRNGHPKK
jgi:hypothetical protein